MGRYRHEKICVAGSYANWMYDLFGHGICYVVFKTRKDRLFLWFSYRWFWNDGGKSK